MPGLEIVSHYVAFIYEVGSRATQFHLCMRSNFRNTIAFSLWWSAQEPNWSQLSTFVWKPSDRIRQNKTLSIGHRIAKRAKTILVALWKKKCPSHYQACRVEFVYIASGQSHILPRFFSACSAWLWGSQALCKVLVVTFAERLSQIDNGSQGRRKVSFYSESCLFF